jgi:hypothetical protein
MTGDERARLVHDLISTWPAGVRGYVWTDALTALRHDVARATYLHLRTHADKAPSVAKFLEEYRARDTERRRREEARQATLPLTHEPPVAPPWVRDGTTSNEWLQRQRRTPA